MPATDWPLEKPRGESETRVNGTANTTEEYTIRTECSAMVFGAVSAGTASITYTSGESGGTAVKLLDLDFSGGVTSLAFTDLRFSPGDQIDLVVDSGATGHVGVKIFHPNEGR